MEDNKKLIQDSFDSLEKYIEKLPVPDKVRRYIWFDSFCKFYDELVPTEDGDVTYGIETKWQLQQFTKQFNENIKSLPKIRLKALQNWTSNLKTTKGTKAKGVLEKQVYELGQKIIFEKMGGEKVTDWQRQLHEYLKHELEFLHVTPQAELQDTSTLIHWQGSDIQLFFLIENLYKLNLILGGSADEIVEHHFMSQTMKPYTQQKVEKPVLIKWMGTTRLLRYLLDELDNSAFIPRRSALNSIIKKHFIKSDNKPFPKSIAQNNTGTGNNKGTGKNSSGKPKGHKEIDKLVILLKNKSDKSDLPNLSD